MLTSSKLPAGLILAFLAACHPAPAEESRDLSREQLVTAFRSPPAEFRPLIIIHSMPLQREDAAGWLAERNAGGAVVDVGVTAGSRNLGGERWNNPTYLNDPARFEKLGGAIEQIRQKGRRVWLYDELGYPSGSAGGRVLAGHPEYQVEVVGCRTFQVDPNETVEIAPDLGPAVACYALPVCGERLDLDAAADLTAKAKGGKFQWRAPAGGRWSVCLFERFQPDTWRRHNIPRRNVNILDRRAVSRFIHLTHDRYAAELGEGLAQVDAFFTDEPQFGSAEHWSGGKHECVPMIQWCDELPTALEEKKGYDLRKILPALFHDAGPETARFRYAFYDVQSDLVAENYFGQIEDWCRRHGVASTGHMLLEESLLFHVMFSGSMMKNWARMDLPGVDLLGASPYKTMAGWERGRFPVPEDFSCKMASSVAHLTGKRGVFTESFALANNAGLRQILGVAAWQFSGGVTHMCTYTIQQQLSPGDYARFSDFVGRLALLARRGRHVADVAVLVPEASVWASYAPPDRGRYEGYFAGNPEPLAIDRVFRNTCHALAGRQRDFDCLSEQLLHRARVVDGRLHLADERFRVLVLPAARMLRRESLEKLRGFLISGGSVAFVGSLPCQSPAHGDDSRMTQEAERLLSDFPAGAMHFAEASRLPELVDWIGRRVPPQVDWRGPGAVRLLHRREPTREIILLANPSAAPAKGRLSLPGPGDTSIWNPETGEVRPAAAGGPGDGLPLEIPGKSARWVVVEKSAP